ncbi:MAG: DUF349 domain-containing protein, partial [Telluria sp.]
EAARRTASLAQAGQLRDKLRLVLDLEQGVAGDGAAPGDDWEERWNALPPLDGELERTLRARFDAALRALEEGRAAYAQLLERNRDALLRELLRAEIRAGIDSGPEFARERLRMQVEVLQSSLKSGHGAGHSAGHKGGQKDGHGGHAAQLRELVALPALVDARTASRIEQLSMRLARERQ